MEPADWRGAGLVIGGNRRPAGPVGEVVIHFRQDHNAPIGLSAPLLWLFPYLLPRKISGMKKFGNDWRKRSCGGSLSPTVEALEPRLTLTASLRASAAIDQLVVTPSSDAGQYLVTSAPALVEGSSTSAPIVDLSINTPFDDRFAVAASDDGPLFRIDIGVSYTLAATGHPAVGEWSEGAPLGYRSYDIDLLEVLPLHAEKHAFAVDTVLARPLLSGDRSLVIHDASGWSNEPGAPGVSRSLAWYGYSNSKGQVYADYTYTRNVATSEDGLWAPDSIWFDPSVNAYRVPLLKPWAGPNLAAGAAVRNATLSDPLATPLAESLINATPTWTVQTATLQGQWVAGRRDDFAFRPGTSYIQPTTEANGSIWNGVAFGPTSDFANPQTTMTPAVSGNRFSLSLDVLAKEVASFTGDFNSDGLIDAADYTLWRDAAAAPRGVIRSSGADATGDGLVDGADYLPWANRYGATTSITIQSATAVYGTVSTVTNGGVAKLAYTSPANFVGTDVVTYTLRDPVSGRTLSQRLVIQAPGSDFATNPTVVAKLVSQALVVTGNLAPRIVYGAYPSYTIGVGQTLTASNLLSGFTDAVDQLVARLVEGPKHGSLKLRYDGTFEYKPNPGLTGVDVFRYEAFEGRHATQAVATIRVLSDGELFSERLYQVAIAMLNHESVHNRFPINSDPTYFDAQGKPYLSWRVHLLPFLGYEDLYAQFRLDESWNSAHNLPLLSQMPNIYRAVGDSAGSVTTRLQTFTGPDAPFGAAVAGADQIGPRLSSFHDGANNTILFIATGASAAVQWTKPDDIEFNPLNPLAGLGMNAGDVLYAMTADAQLVPLSTSVAPEDIAALVTPDGEEVIDVGSIVREYLGANPEVSPELFYRQDREQTYLKQIALAALNHSDVNSRFPISGTSNFDDNGKPYLSWRVHLLPYLGHAALYNRFVLTEPWNSPNNLPLLAEMPDIFRSAEDSFSSMTTQIVTFNGSGAPFGNRALGVDQTGPRFSEILDGPSNTILFAEAAPASAVLWTKPDDIAFNPADPLAGVATGEDIRVVLFNGSYHEIRSDVRSEDFAGLVTHRGSEVVNLSATESPNGFAEKSHNERLSDLKQLVLALLNYESSRTRFPIDIAATDGSPLLSWRVAILPYMEQQALYNRFRRDEPWDSPHNLALLDKMPDVFRGIGDPVDSTTTTVMHFTGAGTPYTIATNGTPVAPRFSTIQDGSSRTIAFVEAGAENAIPWTKPGDLSLDADNPFSTLGDLGESFIAAFFDGHIETLSSKISLGLLKAYITPIGGENTESPPTVTASVGLTVLESAGDTKTNEFGVDVFHVVLDRQPTGDVVVNLATSDAAVAMVDRATLRFTPSNWNKPQPVALRGMDNQAVNLDRVVQVVVAVAPALSAAEYDLLPPTTFTVTITDDEPRTPELPGDYNSDGAVDAADYTVWRDAVGVAGVRPFSGADGNGDSRVDALDHAIWSANYGAIAFSDASLTLDPDEATRWDEATTSDEAPATRFELSTITSYMKEQPVTKIARGDLVPLPVTVDSALLLYLGLSAHRASEDTIDEHSINADSPSDPDEAPSESLRRLFPAVQSTFGE